MIYVYRKALSKGAKELVEALQDGMRWRDRQRPLETKVRPGQDRVICWGDYKPNLPAGVPALNNVPLTNKFTDAQKLTTAGVPTIEVSLTKPQDVVTTTPAAPDPAVAQWQKVEELAEDFLNIEIDETVPRNQATKSAIDALYQEVLRLRNDVFETLAPVAQIVRTTAEGWLGRDRNHVGGADLLTPVATPDFYVKKIDDIIKEYRIHCFLGKSIRAGVKQHRIDDAWTRSGQTPHAWVRSWDGGWRIVYDGVSSKQKHRDLAAQALTALGLDFGAVDIGERADGSLVVFEVNRAPGIEAGTTTKYAEAVEVWRQYGGWEARPDTGN